LPKRVPYQQILEQRHRTSSSTSEATTCPMLGLKSFHTAAVVIEGIEFSREDQKGTI